MLPTAVLMPEEAGGYAAADVLACPTAVVPRTAWPGRSRTTKLGNEDDNEADELEPKLL